jgi:hypothetical protein
MKPSEKLIKERAAMMEERRAKKIESLGLDAAARNELFTTSLRKMILEAKFVAAKPYKTKAKKKTNRIVNIMLSDLHYGANLTGEETPYKYGHLEECRRTAAVVRETCDYKEHYREETELYVHLLGDIIQGRLHDLRDAAPLAEQAFRAIYVLTAAIARFREAYKKVTVFCTPGNHGRFKDRHPERAVNQKWDSLENVIYSALEIHFAGDAGIKFVTPKTPFYEYQAFGMTGFMTHGDTVLNPGYPGKSIGISRLEQQILKITSSKGHRALFGVGHVHVSSATQIPNGSVILTNGCLIPPDEFAVSIGIHATACSQQLWETVPGYMFGDHRVLNVDARTDADPSLDDIIPPHAKFLE